MIEEEADRAEDDDAQHHQLHLEALAAGDDEPADAQIQLTVSEWGFRLTQGFSSVIYPTLNVLAQMDRGDEMIWRTFEAVTPFNGQNVYGYTPLTYRTDPEALRRALTGITQISAQYLVKELK